MSDFYSAIFGILTGLFLGIWLGSTAYDASWQRDCEKIGAHVSSGNVYECKKRSTDGH